LGKEYTLGRQERLKSHKLIEQLFNGGKGFSVSPFRVYYLLDKTAAAGIAAGDGSKTAPSVQCGFGVSSRQFKKAVDRNRVKRVTREAWRLQKQVLETRMEAGTERLAVFLIYTGKELPAFNTVKEKLAVILNKLIAVIDETGTHHP
jgi:ribonuclease P protein component